MGIRRVYLSKKHKIKNLFFPKEIDIFFLQCHLKSSHLYFRFRRHERQLMKYRKTYDWNDQLKAFKPKFLTI